MTPTLPTNGYRARFASGYGGWLDWNMWDWPHYEVLGYWRRKFEPIEDET